jgi:hypothetical protein
VAEAGEEMLARYQAILELEPTHLEAIREIRGVSSAARHSKAE